MPTNGRKSWAQRRTTRTKPHRRMSARAHDDNVDTRPDPVNLILAQWQRERPDLDPAPMQRAQRGVRVVDDVIPQIIAAQWRIVSRLGARKTKTLIDLLADAAQALTVAGNGQAGD